MKNKEIYFSWITGALLADIVLLYMGKSVVDIAIASVTIALVFVVFFYVLDKVFNGH